MEGRQQRTSRRNRGWSGLWQPWVRPALVVGCGIAVFTQLSGIEMIIYYAPTILTDNGFSTTTALSVSVALGMTYLVMMVVGLVIVDKVGRRRLTLVMVPGAAVSLFALGAFFTTGHATRDYVPSIVACLLAFMLFNAGGLQLMGWLTGSEIYPLSVRAAATSVQSATLWSTNLLITLTLLTLLTMISIFGVGQVFWIYGMFNVAAWLFVWRRMPELTGHSLEDIERHLKSGKFRPPRLRPRLTRTTWQSAAPNRSRRSERRVRARATSAQPGDELIAVPSLSGYGPDMVRILLDRPSYVPRSSRRQGGRPH
ncbi:MFS transporter [Streptomyces sp. NPDC051956]|uniref:MFS transporter n=1 Tax=Streptomyces sp. NPDC051956 TaxID=3365677 RepID=UPI0037CE2CC1